MKTLPPLPGSTDEDLRRNQYDSFFRKTPRQFWEEAQIEHCVLQEKPRCDHAFSPDGSGVWCSKCGMGLQGSFDIKEGKLYLNNTLVL